MVKRKSNYYFVLVVGLFVFFTTLPVDLQAQRSKKPKRNWYVNGQVGLVFQRSTEFEERINKTYRQVIASGQNYIGVNAWGFGLVRNVGKKTHEFSVHVVDYTVKYQSAGLGFTINSFRRWYSISGEYYTSLLKFSGKRTTLSFGPNVTLGYIGHSYRSKSTLYFPETRTCYCFGGGPKLLYTWQFSPFFQAIVSTKVSLLDFGYSLYRREDPNLPPKSKTYKTEFETAFLRQPLQLHVGVQYRLSAK